MLQRMEADLLCSSIDAVGQGDRDALAPVGCERRRSPRCTGRETTAVVARRSHGRTHLDQRVKRIAQGTSSLQDCLEVAVISRGSQRVILRSLVRSASVGTLEGLGGLGGGRGVGDRVRHGC